MISEPLPVAVGLGEFVISRNPQAVLVAYGLGSCVGVGIYDPKTRIGGLLHAMLPQRNGSGDYVGKYVGSGDYAGKYVDSGIAQMVAELEEAGAGRGRLIVRIAGGANVLTVPDLKRAFNIGDRNIAAAQSTLAALRLRIQSEDVGGAAGRTVRLYMNEGRMTVRVMGGLERQL